jgi:hypothetical protein
MQKRLLSIITTWPFLLSLAVLLMNDWWLKGAYPGVITGKLSDFAGIAVVTLLLLAAFPQRSLTVFCGLSLTFLWWKSPASDQFIQFFNQLGLYRIARTIDYTDIMALIVFPVCRAVAVQETNFAIPWPRIRRYMTIPAATITIAAIMGTSQRPTLQDYAVRTISTAEELRRDEVVEVIQAVATSNGMVYDKQPNPQNATLFSGDRITMSYSFPNKNTVAFSISAYSNGILSWNKSGYEKADELRNDLKRQLAARFKGLEYIEPLAPQ